jgi:tetratricopeptide (TPR) repeat protein
MKCRALSFKIKKNCGMLYSRARFLGGLVNPEVIMKRLSASFLAILLGFSLNAYAQESPQAALSEGKVSEALAMLDAQVADANAEKSVEGLCGKAQIALAQGDHDTAAGLLATASEKAKGLDKSSAWPVVVSWLQAEAARQAGNEDEVRNIIDGAVKQMRSAKIKPEWAGAIYYLKALYPKDNSDGRDAAEEAIEAYDEAEMHHQKGHAMMRLAQLEWERDKKRRAVKAFESAIKEFRNDGSVEAQRCMAEAQLILAEHFLEDGDMKAAKSRLEVAKKELENVGNPEALVKRLAEAEARAAETPKADDSQQDT